MNALAAIRVEGQATKRRMGVQQALEWAFGREHARLDLGVVDPESHRGGAVGTEWIIWQRHMLGATIDCSGGGSAWGGSAPHHDAEVIAAIVANLSEGSGGRTMAARVAWLAKAGITPDWMPDARPRCVPREWGQNPHGRYARTEVLGTIVVVSRGRRTKRDVTWCPVTYAPTAAQIAAARRGYLDWWGALLAIGHELRICGMLSRIDVTEAMPPMTPWRRDP